MLTSFSKKYFDNWRLFNFGLLIFGLILFLGADWYWSNVCAVDICSVYFIDAYLAPTLNFGIIIAAAATPFLVLPNHYFRTWVLWVFAPLTALALYRVSTIDPNSSNMFADTREEFVAGLLVPWLIVTLLFIAYYYYRTRKLS